MVKACEMIVRSMFLNKFYSEFAPITSIKFQFFPRPNFFTSHTWRHETVHWCITLRRIPVMFKIETLGWLLNIIINYEIIPNQITHSFGRLKKMSKNFCPSLYICVYVLLYMFIDEYHHVQISAAKLLISSCFHFDENILNYYLCTDSCNTSSFRSPIFQCNDAREFAQFSESVNVWFEKWNEDILFWYVKYRGNEHSIPL